MGYDTSATQKAKITRKSKAVRCTRQKKLAPFRFRLAAKAALCNLLLPFPCKPASLGFAWSAQGAFCSFHLDGRQPVCVSKNKNHTKIHHCQVQAVLPEQKCAQAMKSPQAILCVLARALKRHGRFSARQNRVCPCQLMVSRKLMRRGLLGWSNSSCEGLSSMM